jgi:hypothetical protein
MVTSQKPKAIEKSQSCNSEAWQAIFDMWMANHDFDAAPFILTADQMKDATRHFKTTGMREVRILAKRDSREDLPNCFTSRGLFFLPLKNGVYAVLKGEGYLDVPRITSEPEAYEYKLPFELTSSKVGDSEMQHLDFSYSVSMLRTFLGDPQLYLTIRGRKYTPHFTMRVGKFRLEVEGVQTEVDAGYEGKDFIALVEAKNKAATNVIIRQLFYPYRQWKTATGKEVVPVFFWRDGDTYNFYRYAFEDDDDYNSIRLAASKRFKLVR